MGVKRYSKKSKGEYTVSYSGMRGVNFSSDAAGTGRYRFSHIENMYKDYDGGGAGITESIPGFRKILSLGQRINSIFSHKNEAGDEYIVVHAGTSLYRFALENRDQIGNLSPLISLENTKSSAFCFGNDLYVLDGVNIIRISENGSAAYANDSGECRPYIPTTYYNGAEYEQRNLLTNKFQEKYIVSAYDDVATGNEGLKYYIISTTDNTCTVDGIDDSFGGAIHIPSYVNLSGVNYRVTEISERAFYGNEKITSVNLPDTVTKIGKQAFCMCNALTVVVTRSPLSLIDSNAFTGCTSLSEIYLDIGLRKIGTDAFSECPNLKTIHYFTDEQAFSAIEILTSLEGKTVLYNSRYNRTPIEIPIYSPAIEITSVKIENKEVPFSQKTKDTLITAVIVLDNIISVIDGKEFSVSGIMSGAEFAKNTFGTNFISEHGATVSGFDAIAKCTVCESFDGRIFLSGNKLLPNTVFYTSRDSTGKNNPLYFGILNYFNDGIGSFAVESMLATGNSLAVFKSEDDGCGSIYYHTPKETGSDILPIIYPVSYVHSGIHAIGESISFFDDPIFLSSLGVSALDKKNINMERSIAVRSHNINSKLLGEDLKSISMTKWCGYLVLCAGEHMYLADSRDTFIHSTGNTEYEWYYLSGIGTYQNAKKIYKYSAFAQDGYEIHPNTDAIIEGNAYITMYPDGTSATYTISDGKKYAIYNSGQMEGGTFSPATTVCATPENLLFFGTESGDICIFNNDKRGEGPSWATNLSEADRAEYKALFGRRLHPSYYSFDSHAPRYALTTVSDNGGFANLEKTTVKNSLTAKVRMIGNGSFTCEAGTENKGYAEIAKFPGSVLDFAEIDFSKFSFSNSEYATLPFKEREKGWIEKEISFYTDEFESPFGICNISYRFTVKGKIKN